METAFRSEERFTQPQFLEWLEENEGFLSGHCELIDGAVVLTPPARYPHSDVTTNLVLAIGAHVAKRRLGRVYESSAGYELPSGDTLEPDVSFLSNLRLAMGPVPHPGGLLRIVPDLVVEVLSPSTERRDRTEKRRLYGRNGVEEYWLVDPATRIVTVLRLGLAGYDDVREFACGAIRSRVLPNLALAVETVFANLSAAGPSMPEPEGIR
jgi:Uma2 family endonuclease